jgi:hypothetical protein
MKLLPSGYLTWEIAQKIEVYLVTIVIFHGLVQ